MYQHNQGVSTGFYGLHHVRHHELTNRAELDRLPPLCLGPCWPLEGFAEHGPGSTKRRN